MPPTPPPPPPTGLLDTVYLGNSLLAWLLALGAAIAVFLAGTLLRRMIVGYANRHAAEHRRGVASLLHQLARRLSMTVVLALAVMAATYVLVLPGGVERALRLVIVVALAWQFIRWGHAVIDFGLDSFARRHAEDGDTGAAIATSMGVIRVLTLVALYCLVGLMAAQNMGIDVTALVAGMGIGGIAVALAVQNVLGDLFGSLSIVLDKPFVVGDFIVVGDQKGTVERIGVKTTRVRSLSGEQLVFSNSDLLGSRIQNFKRMNERRVSFVIGVPHDTPPDGLERVATILGDVIRSQRGVRVEAAYFKAVAASSFEFEAIYHVLSTDLARGIEIQHEINLGLARRFADEGLRFALPAQDLRLVGGLTAEGPTGPALRTPA